MSDISKYVKKINKMAAEDQKLRKKFEESGFREDIKSKMLSVDEDNTKELKRIMEKIGLPTISKVGKIASRNAWLIVQHSPDKRFMEDYLELMEDNISDIDIKNYAYLKDRILVYKGKRQVFGTQFRVDPRTGTVTLATQLRNEKETERLRKECGMISLKQQLNKLEKTYPK